MKFLLCVAAVVFAAAPFGWGQQSPEAQTSAEHPGKIILQRSVGDDPQGSAEAAVQELKKPDPTDNAEANGRREAITFLTYDLDIHLQPAEHGLSVRARMQLRNDSDKPITLLPLQISSSLRWTSVRVAGVAVTFTERRVDSDVDHTGVLREVEIPLAQPLGAKQTLAVDATYEGTVPLSAARLEQIGTPADLAEASDWDRVSEDFVGVRGFGNVVWYPIASVPVALGDGARYFTQAAAERQRQSEATVSMRVTEEFFGEAPNVGVLDGEIQTLSPTSLPVTGSVPGIVTCTLPPTRLGFASPSFFLMTRTVREGDGARVFARAEDADSAAAYLAAAKRVTPMIQRWLGNQPRGPLNIIDLPDRGDAAFENGDVLFANIHDADANQLADTLVHSLTHLYFRSSYPWLQEGVASFMSSLWVEQGHGRDVAIQQMDNTRGALSLAEPGDVVGKGFQPLLTARDPVYYRTKATYVFWMLRDLVGDDALGRSLRAYQPGADVAGTGFEQVLSRVSGTEVKWFFEDWVYRDRGLPDLSIAGVYPNAANTPGSYIVSVDVANSGSAEASVPVSVSSGTTTVMDRVRVPAKSKVSHRFLLQGPPAEVSVNDGTVPEVQASVHRETLTVPPASQ